MLGVHDTGDRILLLSEDLNAAGYRTPGTHVSEAQLLGTIDTLVDLHVHFGTTYRTSC
ncbi:hypothetical protein [Kribbella antiqua]|uniref:hypothetical protein n=1 Tax=Kribbella antiqua TaxID=2512217 RepID=UPI0013050EBD|nr:hypothetical protein [Kribbella antiqua]